MSSFSGRGKKTAWATRRAFPEVTDAFIELECMPSEVSEESMSQHERFAVLTHDRTSDITEINEATQQLFAHKGRTLENQAALKQHIKLTCYLVNIWNQSFISEPEILNPSDWAHLGGSLCGQVSLKLQNPAKNLSTVAARSSLDIINAKSCT